MVVHGGANATSVFADTWVLSLAGTPTWSPLAVWASGPQVYLSPGIYDPIRDRMVIVCGDPPSGVTFPSKTWALTFAMAPSWTEILTGGVAVGGRYLHGLAYEPEMDLLVASAGIGGSGVYQTDNKRLDCAGGWWLDAKAANGSVQVVPNRACFPPSQVATLVASPSGGAVFNQWLGDASGNSNPLDVTMNANKTIVAEILTRTTGVEDAPTAFSLAIRPNPSIGAARIEYALPREARVKLCVYDIGGRLVARLVDEKKAAGRYVATWSGVAASARPHAGMYLVRLDTPDHTWTQRLALLR
jgi:hypothetical protein